VCCLQQRKTAKKDRRSATSQVKRAPPNGTIRFFAHTSELKHFGAHRGVIHPGLRRSGSCQHRDLESRLTKLFWKLLFDALMRPGSIEVLDIGVKDTVQLLLLQDEKVIETRSPHTPQQPLTDRIGSRCMGRRGEHLAAAGCGHARNGIQTCYHDYA